ncbi:MAG: Crp/Fnr family transcriptional regulator [Suipraeoptans sp.]
MGLVRNERMQEILNRIDTLPEDHRAYMNRMFQNAPLSVFESMELKRIKPNSVFVREAKKADNVFILIEGQVQAVEHRIMGNEYNYMQFKAIKVFGAMEILLGFNNFKTTLMTVGECTFLVMKRQQYKQWIENDNNALLMETYSMGRYLLEQARKERLFLFLYGRDRLFLVFSQEYENYHDIDGNCKLSRSHQDLAESSGLSVRTINRALQSMRNEGYIKYHRGEIRISKSQYAKIVGYLEQFVDKEMEK